MMTTQTFELHCYQTLTGTKFLLFCEVGQPNAEGILRRCYECYADYVMKNPFYQLEMPIRVEAFERVLAAWIRSR